MNNKLLIITLSVIAFLLLPNEKPSKLSGLKRKSKRLFYISNNRVIPRNRIENEKQKARTGKGCLHAVWAYSADEARELIRQGKAESICLFTNLKAISEDAVYMKSSPISKELQRRFENTTFSPFDLNKEFNDSVFAKEQEVIEQLNKYGVKDFPDDVKTALTYYRKALYEFLVTKANQVPGPMVTGPSKYNYSKLDRSIKKEDKALDKIELSKQYLKKAINQATKNRMTTTKQISHDNWKKIAINITKKEFAEQFFQSAYDKANPNLRKDYDAGVFVRALKNKAKKMHERLIDEAISEGLSINESVKKDYPERFGIPTTQKKKRASQADKLTAYEQLLKRQEESQRIADEASRESREKIEAAKERMRIFNENKKQQLRKKTLPEQTDMFQPTQMTLFGYKHGRKNFTNRWMDV